MRPSPVWASVSGVVPLAGAQPQLGDRPVVHGQAGDVARLLGARSTGMEGRLGLAKLVGVGKSAAMPQQRDHLVGPGAVASLGDRHGPLRLHDGLPDEALSEGYHCQGCQSETQRVVVADTSCVRDGSTGGGPSAVDLAGQGQQQRPGSGQRLTLVFWRGRCCLPELIDGLGIPRLR